MREGPFGAGKYLPPTLQQLSDLTRRLPPAPIPQALLLMGPPKSGKTTLLYHLQGRKLLQQKNHLDFNILLPQQPQNNAQIATQHTPDNPLPNTLSHSQETTVIDLPSLGQNNQQNCLVRIAALLRVTSIVESGHICYLIPEDIIEGQNLLKQFQLIRQIFSPTFINSPQTLSFVLTKVQNQDTADIFQNHLSQLKQQNQEDASYLDLLSHKNIYIFKNSQPGPLQGPSLKQKIATDNPLPTIQSPILSPQFIRHITADFEQQFDTFMTHLAHQLRSTSISVIQLSYSLLTYQLSDVIKLLEKQRQFFDRELNDEIEELRKNISVNGINYITWQDVDPDDRSANYPLLHLFLSRKTTQNHTPLHNQLTKIDGLIHSTAQPLKKIKKQFTSALHKTCLELTNLLSIVKQIQKPQLDDILSQTQQIDTIYIKLDKYSSMLMDDNEQYSNNVRVGSSGGVTEKIVRVRQFQKVRDQNCAELIGKIKKEHTNRTNKKNKPNQFYIDDEPEDYGEQITSKTQVENLPLNSHSLKQLLTLLQQNLNHKLDRTFLSTILKKVSSIFSKYSFFEQALLFSMAVPDHPAIDQLLAQGTLCQQLSPSFTAEVMIPYLQHCYSGKNMRSNLEQCLNNLHRDGLDHKLVEVEVCVLGQLKNPRSNMTISERDEPYPLVNIIDPLLQSTTLYHQLLQQREALFQRSLFLQFAGSGLS